MDTQIFSRLLLYAALTTVVGCTSYGPVLRDADIRAAKLVEGDRVRIVTKSGEKHRFVVREIEPTAIVGGQPEVSGTRSPKRIRVEYAEIETLEVRELSEGKTVVAAAGGGAAVLFLVLLLSAGTFIFP